MAATSEARQKQAFITLITLLSMAGITVGVMALIVVIGVMKGFEDDLRSRILGGQSHVVVKSETERFPDTGSLCKRWKS